jgi:hypothetical protein
MINLHNKGLDSGLSPVSNAYYARGHPSIYYCCCCWKEALNAEIAALAVTPREMAAMEFKRLSQSGAERSDVCVRNTKELLEKAACREKAAAGTLYNN